MNAGWRGADEAEIREICIGITVLRDMGEATLPPRDPPFISCKLPLANNMITASVDIKSLGPTALDLHLHNLRSLPEMPRQPPNLPGGL